MSAAPIKLALALVATLGALNPVAAQKPKAPAKVTPTPPSPEQLRAASDTLSLLVSALNSKDVPQATKNGLFLCLYGNPLGKIARGQSLALAAGKGGESATPTQRLLILVELCDAPSPGAAAPAGAAPEPKRDEPSAAEDVPAITLTPPADAPKRKKQPESR